MDTQTDTDRPRDVRMDGRTCSQTDKQTHTDPHAHTRTHTHIPVEDDAEEHDRGGDRKEIAGGLVDFKKTDGFCYRSTHIIMSTTLHSLADVTLL